MIILLSQVLQLVLTAKLPIVEINDENYDTAIVDYPALFVYYNSDDLESYSAVDALKAALPKMELFGISVGKVDCAKEHYICEDAHVRKTPAVKLQMKLHSMIMKGHITPDNIVSFVEKKITKSVRVFKNRQQANLLIEGSPTNLVVGSFGSRNTDFNVFSQASEDNAEGDVYIAVINETITRSQIEYVHVKENYTELYTGRMFYMGIGMWIRSCYEHVYEELDAKSVAHFAMATKPVVFLLSETEEEKERIIPVADQLGKKYRKQLLVALGDKGKEYPKEEQLKLKDEKCSCVFVYNKVSGEEEWRERLDGPFDPQAVLDFVTRHMDKIIPKKPAKTKLGPEAPSPDMLQQEEKTEDAVKETTGAGTEGIQSEEKKEDRVNSEEPKKEEEQTQNEEKKDAQDENKTVEETRTEEKKEESSEEEKKDVTLDQSLKEEGKVRDENMKEESQTSEKSEL
ncbi:hypothetical protein BLNAU_2574 [Blattamonas nauphoetae]|uniref:Thioredoxin domain-containing protein n=1 Tax=Blattamonas nauphoetae TaxID=2049346 RepID=A0ABQ9YFC6_9EUKA|nr:hypothetical protein BLNAU_2574 [Blattamonas nauphoetae]